MQLKGEAHGLWLSVQVALHEGQSAEDGKKIADDLVEKLEIDRSDLLSHAYMDMLLANDR